MTPFFSIIVPDFCGVVDRHRRRLCIEALRDSSFSDFECLWFHDGDLDPSIREEILASIDSDSRFSFLATPERANDWGHTLRDMGIWIARGKYILHLNADNLLYSNSLEVIHRYSEMPRLEGVVQGANGEERMFCVNPEVLIFAIRMMGCVSLAGVNGFLRFKGSEDRFQLVLPGWPPQRRNIDAMQLVATREIWLREGGWHDKSEESDGILLPSIADKYGYLVIPEILGEHW